MELASSIRLRDECYQIPLASRVARLVDVARDAGTGGGGWGYLLNRSTGEDN